ncbi:MAG: CDP-diacylglycerol--glycerol-3-phosphate 3-phosphatidyltransferase [Pseudomonadota bacterium]
MWTVPNLLTIARIAAAPAVALMLMSGGGAPVWALVVFTVAALTDFVDGWLARRLGQVSALGTMLDPIADKAMVIIVLAALMADDSWLPVGGALLVALPAVVIMLREVLVSGLREYLGAVKLAVTPLAKGKTTLQLVAIGTLIGAPALRALGAGPGAADTVLSLGLLLLWLAAGLTLWTGIDYFLKARPHLAARKER